MIINLCSMLMYALKGIWKGHSKNLQGHAGDYIVCEHIKSIHRCFLDAKGLVQALNDFYLVEDQVCKVIANSSRHQTLLDDFFHLS